MCNPAEWHNFTEKDQYHYTKLHYLIEGNSSLLKKSPFMLTQWLTYVPNIKLIETVKCTQRKPIGENEIKSLNFSQIQSGIAMYLSII